MIAANMARGQTKPAGSIRVIAGKWRGRRIPVAVKGIRPSGDRIRETLFNWLQPWVVGARCLDLFAGTGVLGIEALSRGANRVLFVEQQQSAARALRALLESLETEAGSVLHADALTADLKAHGPYDLVFLDPPFGGIEFGNLCKLLERSQCLAEQAHIYIELARQDSRPELPENWRLIRERTAGAVQFGLIERT